MSLVRSLISKDAYKFIRNIIATQEKKARHKTLTFVIPVAFKKRISMTWIFHESFFDDAFRRRIEISVGKCLSLFSSKFVHWIWKVHINKDWSISPNALTVSELFWRPSLAAAWCSAEEVDVVAGQNKDRYRKVRRMWPNQVFNLNLWPQNSRSNDNEDGDESTMAMIYVVLLNIVVFATTNVPLRRQQHFEAVEAASIEAMQAASKWKKQ